MKLNLWKETIIQLDQHGKTFADVRYIQNSDFQIPKENFEGISKRTNYHTGGFTQIPLDLVLVGDDWWLERHSFDGAEWWEYKEKPAKITKCKEIKSLEDL